MALPRALLRAMASDQAQRNEQNGAPAYDDDHQHRLALLRLNKLPPLVDQLAASLTCSVCLEYMTEAHQLQCSHIFCPACITRMLALPLPTCPICKRKTAKRMLSPIISFSSAVASLRALQQILHHCNLPIPPSHPAPALHDGFDAAVSSAVAAMQTTQRRLSLKADQFDPADQHRRHAVSRVCALCPKGVHPSFFPDHVRFGPIKPAPSPSRNTTLYAHHNCAMYSSTVYDVQGTLHAIDHALSRSNHVVCARPACGRTRATVPCAAPHCPKHFHYACALLERCVMVEDGYKAYCPQHAEHAPDIDDATFRSSLSHPATRESLQHDDVCYLCNRGGRLLMCDTCDRCVHPACTALRSIPAGDWSCAVCLAAAASSAAPSSRAPPNSKKRARGGESCQNSQSEQHVTAGINKRARTKAGATPKSRAARKRLVLSYTGLVEPQRELLRTLAKSRRCGMRNDVDDKVTHVVLSCQNVSDKPVRTMKLCKAIASKKSILCWKWVEKSFHERNQWAHTDAYVHNLTWNKDAPPVYDGIRFHFGCYNGAREKKEELMGLVQMGGGCVVRGESGVDSGAQEGVVYVVEELDVKRSSRREQMSRLEPPAGAKVVTSTWVLDLCTKKRDS